MTGTPQELAAHLLKMFGDNPQTRVQCQAVLCPSRGEILPVSEQPEGCGCGELSRCHAGHGPEDRPHAVSLAECIACVLSHH